MNRILLPFWLVLLMLAGMARADAANPSVPANYKVYTPLEIGDILFDTPKAPKQKLVTTKLGFVGKVLKSPQLKNDEVVVYRVIITCCIADALPLGILVKLPDKTAFREGDWVGIEGTLQLLPFNDKLKSIEPLANMVPPEKIYPYCTATKAYKLNTPKDEYLYVRNN